jgi:hypothetical protein
MWNVLIVPTVWYFNCSRQYGMFLLFIQCGILTAPTVWYFNCPQQYGIFLLFLECGILTLADNMECSNSSYSVVF